MIDLSWLPSFLLPLWQWMLRRLPLRSSGRLIFVEQPPSWWTYQGGAIYLRLTLHVTNDSEFQLIFSNVQVRQMGWLKYPWQDCMEVELDGYRLTTGTIWRTFGPQTTKVLSILHEYNSERPGTEQPIQYLLRIRDQRRRLHYARLTVPWRGT